MAEFIIIIILLLLYYYSIIFLGGMGILLFGLSQSARAKSERDL